MSEAGGHGTRRRRGRPKKDSGDEQKKDPRGRGRPKGSIKTGKKMSIIIRLQNLPSSANSDDIRRYFSGISIPEGGIHIVGGEMGEAFITFSTDEDARLAMAKDGGKIKDMQIKLLLSSRIEMMRVIEQASTPNVIPAPPVLVPPPAPFMVMQPPARVHPPVVETNDRKRERSPSPHRRPRERSPPRDRYRSPDGRLSRRDRSRSPRSNRGSSQDTDSDRLGHPKQNIASAADQRNSPAPLVPGSQKPFDVTQGDSQAPPGGRRRKSRFEPEFVQPPAESRFPQNAVSSEEPRGQYADKRMASQEYVSGSRNSWSREGERPAEKTPWNEKRPTLLQAPSSKNVDFVQVVPMDLDPVPEGETQIPSFMPPKEASQTSRTSGNTARNDMPAYYPRTNAEPKIENARNNLGPRVENASENRNDALNAFPRPNSSPRNAPDDRNEGSAPYPRANASPRNEDSDRGINRRGPPRNEDVDRGINMRGLFQNEDLNRGTNMRGPPRNDDLGRGTNMRGPPRNEDLDRGNNMRGPSRIEDMDRRTHMQGPNRNEDLERGTSMRGPPRNDDLIRGANRRGPPRNEDVDRGINMRGLFQNEDLNRGTNMRGPPRNDDLGRGTNMRGPPRNEDLDRGNNMRGPSRIEDMDRRTHMQGPNRNEDLERGTSMRGPPRNDDLIRGANIRGPPRNEDLIRGTGMRGPPQNEDVDRINMRGPPRDAVRGRGPLMREPPLNGSESIIINVFFFN